MDNTKQSVVFLDAYNLIYRAFHGNQSNLTNANGLPTNAIFTTVKMLQKIPKNFNNLAYCVAVFDGGKNFREELDENYKANRKPMPEELRVQMPYIKLAFDILGWPTIQAENVEADDVIGTLANRAAKAGFNTYIISGDKDFRQIVKDNLFVWDTMQDIVYDPETIKEKMGVEPKNVVPFLAMLGDTADNVIGIDKVGKGTAAKLLNEYGSLEGIIENKDSIKGKVGENLREAISNGQLQKNIELITLKLDLDINYTSKQLRLKEVDGQRFYDFCMEMNFKSLIANSPKP